MKAYKMRKIFETVIFPVESELRKMHEENDKSWKELMWQITSVSFSGIGTTVLSQNGYLPSLIKMIFPTKNKYVLIFFEIFVALLIFVLFTFIAWKVIKKHMQEQDEKKDDNSRNNLAEYYHKIILNNILTGISFVKMAYNKKSNYDDKLKKVEEIKKEEDKKIIMDSLKFYRREIQMYVSEAIYYFKVADLQMTNKQIIEFSMRKEYVEFIKIVGLSTLENTLKMYQLSFENLKNLNEVCMMFQIEDKKSDEQIIDSNCIDIQCIESFLSNTFSNFNKMKENYANKMKSNSANSIN